MSPPASKTLLFWITPLGAHELCTPQLSKDVWRKVPVQVGDLLLGTSCPSSEGGVPCLQFPGMESGCQRGDRPAQGHMGGCRNEVSRGERCVLVQVFRGFLSMGWGLGSPGRLVDA